MAARSASSCMTAEIPAGATRSECWPQPATTSAPRRSTRATSRSAASDGSRPRSLVALEPEDVRLQRIHTVQEQDPVEVVELVQKAARLEALRLDPAGIFRGGRRLHHDAGRPPHIRREVRDAEAAFTP